MNKKQIISSLMISGILLTNIAQVSAATQNGTVGSEVPASSSVKNNVTDFSKNTTENINSTLDSTVTGNQNKEATVVNSFSELQTVLSSDNGIVDVALGSDITITSGIEINSNKASVTIDGGGHTLTEGTFLNGPHGTIYIAKDNGTKDVTLKNISVSGKDFYGTVAVDDTVHGVTLNYEGVTYNGPQLVHNVHGFAKFSGTNNIDIVTNGSGSDAGEELMEGLGVEIGGDFTLTHQGQINSAFWFGLGNDARPYFKISDNANVSMDIQHNTMFYIDNSLTHPVDITVGKNAKFDVKTTREFFGLGRPGNVDLLDGSTTTISRTSATSATATMNLSGSNFTVETNANLNINHAAGTTAPAFSGDSNSTINFDSANQVDLHVPPTAKVFSSAMSNSELKVNTNTLQSWHGNDNTTPDYQDTEPLNASISFGLLGSVTLNSSNQPDILSHWKVGNTNHLVLNGKAISDNAPVIEASDKIIKVGDTFNPKADVTATDVEDGDLTSSIVVVSNNVDTTKAGSYQVTYSVTDSSGNTVEKTINVVVEEVATNNAPVIEASDKTIKVGDTFNPKADVTATDVEDGDLTSSIVVVSNNVDTTKAGSYQVTYSVTDSSGNTVEKTINVVVENVAVTSGTVEPDNYNLAGKRSVTGTYTGDVASVRLEINGVLQAVGGTVSDGKFSYYVGGKIASVTDDVWVIGYDSTGKELDREKVTITAPVTEGTVDPDDYNLLGKRSVTGTYTGDVASVRLEINGALQAVGGTVSDGKFSYYVGGKIASATDDVRVIGYDSTGKELDREKVTITAPVTEGTVDPDDYNLLGKRSVTGTYTGDVASVRLEINGVLQAVGGTVSDGKFSYYVGGKIASTNDTVYVHAYDRQNKELAKELVVIAATK